MTIHEEHHWRVAVGGDSRVVDSLQEAQELEKVLLLAEDIEALGSFRSSDVGPEDIATWLLNAYHLIPRGTGAAKAAKDLSEQLLTQAVVATVKF